MLLGGGLGGEVEVEGVQGGGARVHRVRVDQLAGAWEGEMTVRTEASLGEMTVRNESSLGEMTVRTELVSFACFWTVRSCCIN